MRVCSALLGELDFVLFLHSAGIGPRGLRDAKHVLCIELQSSPNFI